MGEMVATVPAIQGSYLEERGRAVLGVDVAATGGCCLGGVEEGGDAVVERRQEGEGVIDGTGNIRRLRPALFVVDLDGGPVVAGCRGKGALDAQVGVRVGVGKMVSELPQGPAADAIGSSKFTFAETGEDGDTCSGERADRHDVPGEVGCLGMATGRPDGVLLRDQGSRGREGGHA